ncbi:unannotated protein [freshwater metagenome]|uniref:Unannotated protein n=1 Tax=freshwater metagenome TaxID=449393 RepID=A0A6J7R520_9ZZZZ
MAFIVEHPGGERAEELCLCRAAEWQLVETDRPEALEDRSVQRVLECLEHSLGTFDRR